MNINRVLITLLLVNIFFTSCSNDDDAIPEPKGDYENGILISGEGSEAATGSISFVSNDFSTTENSIYKKTNTTELGTYLQSIAFDNEKAFIVVDNTNTVTIVNRYTFEEETSVATGLINPRFMVVSDGKGYVTNWGSTAIETDDFIAVINLDTYLVETTIPVKNGPEQIIENNGKLYVSHKGAYGTNNIISVIDLSDNSVEEITVGFKPNDLSINNQGELVVLCGGNESWVAAPNVETLASIIKINVSNNSISSNILFAEGEHPGLMVLEGDKIYYNLNSNVYVIDENATTLSDSPIVDTKAGYLYGIEVKNGLLYTLDASFTDVSKLNVYDLNTEEVTFTTDVALGAAKIYFN